LNIKATLDEALVIVILELDFELASSNTFADEFMLCRCAANIMLTYEAKLGVCTSSDVLGAFAFINSSQTAWPYFRQAIQELTLKFGLPPVVLPTRHLHPVEKKADSSQNVVAEPSATQTDLQHSVPKKRRAASS
jgi:hypothetical protein